MSVAAILLLCTGVLFVRTTVPLVVVAPKASVHSHVLAGFGPELPLSGIEADVQLAQPPDACQPLSNAHASLRGTMVLVVRGNCDFFDKCVRAQNVRFQWLLTPLVRPLYR